MRRLAPRPLRQDRRVSEAASKAREPAYTRLVDEGSGSGNRVTILLGLTILENQNMKTAGIDVSHKTVTLAINRAGRIGKPHDFKNTAQGHLALIRAVRKAQVSRICPEATGRYHLDLALALYLPWEPTATLQSAGAASARRREALRRPEGGKRRGHIVAAARQQLVMALCAIC